MDLIKQALLQKALKLTSEEFTTLRSAPSFSQSQPEPGAIWITCLDGNWGSWSGQIISCYYHPTKKHSATTVGKNGQKKSVEDPGKWAVSAQTRAFLGNKCYYNTLDK